MLFQHSLPGFNKNRLFTLKVRILKYCPYQDTLHVLYDSYDEIFTRLWFPVTNCHVGYAFNMIHIIWRIGHQYLKVVTNIDIAELNRFVGMESEMDQMVCFYLIDNFQWWESNRGLTATERAGSILPKSSKMLKTADMSTVAQKWLKRLPLNFKEESFGAIKISQ